MEISIGTFLAFTLLTGPTIIAPLIVFCCGLLPKTHNWALNDTEAITTCCVVCFLVSLVWTFLLIACIIIGPIIFGLYYAAKAGQSSSKKLQEYRNKMVQDLKEEMRTKKGDED